MDLFCQEAPRGRFKASDIEVRVVGRTQARDFYKAHHYLGGVGNNATNIGVFVKNSAVLVACVSFAIPCSENVRSSVFGEEHKLNVTELARLAISSEVTINASSVVPLCIDALKAHRLKKGLAPIYGLISYADSVQDHHGGIYQAMSWIYTGESRPTKPFYIDSDGNMRHPRQNTVNIPKEEALAKGWQVVDASIKYRYVKILGGPRTKKKYRSLLKLPQLPYPKPAPRPEPTPDLNLEPSCGCRGGFTRGAIALYGVRACYNLNSNCEHEFDLAPTYAQLVAVNPEVEARFRKNLQGQNGYISMARTMFREHMGFDRAPIESEGYHSEPTCIFDIGSCSFWAQKRGTYVYVTWAYYDRPMDFEAANKWALTQEIYNLRSHSAVYASRRLPKSMEVQNREAREYEQM